MSRATFTHDSPGTSAARWRSRPERDDLPTIDVVRYQRLMVVAAHPDDESLGAGGLIVEAAERGLEITVLLATAGERSHPHSTLHSPQELGTLRLAEAHAALAVLAPDAELVFLGAADGAVADAEERLTTELVERIGELGAGTLLVAPWRQDGHPDHEAAGRATAAAALRTDAELLEYPIWWWHWSQPQDAPWDGLRRLPLSASARERRDSAVRSHRSQVEPLSDQPGDEVLLTADMLAHFEGPEELFVVEPPQDSRLDVLHRETADPWGVDERWYEERKRMLVLAMLPHRRFQRILDIGCSTGALTADLVERLTPTGELLALDASPAAIDAARNRLAGSPAADRLQLEVADLPDAWPERCEQRAADLIVVSEMAYFLSPQRVRRLATRLGRSVRADGVLLLCHWRHPLIGWPLDGPRAHRVLCEAAGLPVQARYADRDVEILVLARDEVWPESDR